MPHAAVTDSFDMAKRYALIMTHLRRVCVLCSPAIIFTYVLVSGGVYAEVTANEADLWNASQQPSAAQVQRLGAIIETNLLTHPIPKGNTKASSADSPNPVKRPASAAQHGAKSAMHAGSVTSGSSVPQKTTITVCILMVLITFAAVVLGICDRAVFFWDKEDVMFTFLTFSTPFIALAAGGLLRGDPAVVAIMTLAAFSLMVVVTFTRSIHANQGLLVGCTMAIGKLCFLPFCLVPLALNSKGSEAQERRPSLLYYIFLGTLTVTLINGKRVLARKKKDEWGGYTAESNDRPRWKDAGHNHSNRESTNRAHHDNQTKRHNSSRFQQQRCDSAKTGSGMRHDRGKKREATFVFADDADPYTVLGIPPNASKEQIRDAYLRRIRQNHPDKVAGMDPVIREVAAQRSSAINRAYEDLNKC
jgi:hypothetical protein